MTLASTGLSAEEQYILRPPSRNDAALAAAVMNACQSALGDPPDMTVEELLKDWVDADLDNEARSVIPAL